MTKLLKTKEACELLGVCPNTLKRYDRNGISVRIGRAVRYDSEALIAAVKGEQQAAGVKEENNA
ncbi:helix-turn-helix domain-containing protein [Butyrivibrio sp. AC2005]|uniref:helix-turn-helix domain-containing protein n=1 Tax=Butyrivibrio sp. AC2005 TaxID=1280672 RepID=UPI000416AED0|nr:helix-turn-helix domain-containing protein [Butyrivibrio sp. AC2005]